MQISNLQRKIRPLVRRSSGVELEFGYLEVGAERSDECPNEAIDKGG